MQQVIFKPTLKITLTAFFNNSHFAPAFHVHITEKDNTDYGLCARLKIKKQGNGE